MKILLINKFLYPKGGDAISTLTTGKILSDHGHEVHYWGMQHQNNPEYKFQDVFVSQIDYDNSPGILAKFKSARNILYSFEAKRKIGKLFEEFKPDIIHLNNFAHQISPSILDEIKKHNIPVVMTMHDYKMVCPCYSMLVKGHVCEKCRAGRYYNCILNKCTKNSFFNSFINAIEMYLHHRVLKIYDKIDLYISPSLFLRDKVKEMGLKGEVEYLSNCVDCTQFESDSDFQEKSIVYVGRISHEKGIATLIKAVKKIKEIRLKIIGDGPLKAGLEKEVQDEHIQNISFFGYKTGSDLHDEIRKSMFLVIPSECYENNPRTVIEAFALGKPALGARIGGIPELVKDWETGLTYTSGDADDLQEKIRLMLEHEEKIKNMGRTARKYVEDNLGSNTYYVELMKLYEKATELSKTKNYQFS